MHYHIGLVARLLGISAEGLRLYEREGILQSKREKEGGYRYYQRLDITALLRARAYQKYGFSLRETGALLNTGDLALVERACRRREKELEEEIRRKTLLLDSLRETRSLTASLPDKLGKVERGERPGLYRLEYMVENDLILPPARYDLFRRWAALSPFPFPSQKNSWQALLEGEDRSVAALGLLERDAVRLGAVELASAGEYLPPCPCLCTVVKVAGETARCTDYLDPLRQFVRREGIQVTGDPVSRAFLSLDRKGSYTRYRQIWLPVAEA